MCSLALLEGELVGDPLEKAALAAIDWSLGKSTSSITQAGGGAENVFFSKSEPLSKSFELLITLHLLCSS